MNKNKEQIQKISAHVQFETVSPATKLLEERRKMYEVHEAFEVQKEEFKKYRYLNSDINRISKQRNKISEKETFKFKFISSTFVNIFNKMIRKEKKQKKDLSKISKYSI